jgi:hypothetical protein
MHHINAEVVSGIHISSVVQQHLNERNVASEAGEVQGSEAVVNSLLVDPLSEFTLNDCLLCTLNNNLCHILKALKAS